LCVHRAIEKNNLALAQHNYASLKNIINCDMIYTRYCFIYEAYK